MLSNDDYDLVERINNKLGILVKYNDDMLSAVNNIESKVDNERILESLSNILLELLHETKKTNFYLKKKANIADKKIDNNEINYEKLTNRNLLIVRDDVQSALGIVDKITKIANKNYSDVTSKVLIDLSTILRDSNVNDYIFVNYDILTNEQRTHIKNCILNGRISAAGINLDIKPLNYLVYTDTLELFDKELINEFEILN